MQADAITEKNTKLRFGEDQCLRCYCCIEVCPHGALRARDTMPGRLMQKLIRRV